VTPDAVLLASEDHEPAPSCASSPIFFFPVRKTDLLVLLFDLFFHLALQIVRGRVASRPWSTPFWFDPLFAHPVGRFPDVLIPR